MDRTGEVFLQVLRNGLWKKEETIPDAGDFRWEDIFRMAKAQSLTGIIGQAVLDSPDAAASLPEGYRENIKSFIIKNCAVHSTFNRCLVHVVSALRAEGVEPVLLKGQGLARNWPCPELRQCGDIDLWVGEENYTKAINILLPLSSSESNDIEESIKHASLPFGAVKVEIHRFSGVDTSSRKLDAIYRKYSEDGLSNRTVPLDFSGTGIMTPSDNFNAFYIFSHLWHHFMTGGIGLRQICDWALFLHSRKDAIDTGYLEKVLEELDMKEAWQVFGCIASDWLGLPSCEFPFYNPECRAKAEKVLARILREGNFGHERACFRKKRSKVYLFRKAGSFMYHISRNARLLLIFPAQTAKEFWNTTISGFKAVWKRFFKKYIVGALRTNIPVMLACLAAAVQLSSMLYAGTKEAHYVLSNKDGLSNNSVTCICQDSAGIVWTGTWEGLNAYNSSGFRIWKSNPADSNTLSSNIIRGISEQRPGIMWVTTDYGVNRIDVRNERIRRFYLGYEHKNPAKDKTFDLSVSDSRQVFCSAAGWGLAHYNESADRMEAFNIPEMNTSDAANIHCLGDDRLIIISQQGHAAEVTYRFLESGQVDIVDKTDLLSGTITTASFKTGNSLFLVSRDSLYRYHAGHDGTQKEGGMQKMKAFPLPRKGEVRAVTEVSEDEIIIAFYDYGVMRLSLTEGMCTNMPALQDVNIFALHYGTQDILWAGTDGQGLWAVYDDDFGMNKVSSAVMFQSGRAPVRSFFKDGDKLYVGTKGNGIFVMDSNSLIGRYDKSNGLSDNAVYAFERGYDDDVFIGTGESGLNVLSLRTGKMSRIIPGKECMFNEVYDIKRDDANGCLWVGTYGCGLIRLNLEYREGKYRITGSKVYVNNKENPRSINSNIVFPLLQDGPDRLWVGTKGGGLDLLDIRNDTFSHSTVSSAEGSISSNDVSSLFFSRDSTLWIGTSYGLNRLAGHEGSRRIFESFTDRDGLVNNSTHGIAEDASGNLWISTSGGLSVFNPEHGSFINYSNDDALQNNEYADGAILRSGETVYFGGVDGYNWFNPDGIHMRTYKPNIVFSGIRIMDRGPENVMQGEHIVLKHNENFFDLHFSAIEFIDNAKCEYAYILEGFSTGWVHTGSGIASFTNVPPGRYIFKVRCTNGDKVWNSDTAAIPIRVRRPWWNTIAANCMYIIFMLALAYAVFMFFNERVRQRHELEIETLKKKKLVDTYEAKLRFFTNIAHEFMTPLTLIIGPIEQMAGGKYNFPPKVSKYHRIIYSNAERMRRLIQELIDFRRIDTESVKPVYSNVDIAEITEGILDNFSEINEEQDITIETAIPESGLPSVCDRNAVEKILYNLISNAYKYTPAGGRIWISTEKEEGNIHFVITNSGKGIRPENIDKIFDRFVILDNYESQASKGSVIRNGIGMALVHSLVKMLGGEIIVTSVPGESTTFRLRIPEGDAGSVSNSAVISVPEYALPAERAGKESEEPDRMNVMEDCETIMIVDDEKSIRDLVADILGEDYRIIQAGNGTEAVEQLKQVRPDLIITDLNMPQMNGAELLKYVKSNDITKSIPVIFLAFKSDMETESELYELGSEVFIPKPFSTRHLTAVVGQVLKNRSVLKDWYNSALSSADVYQGNIVDSSDKDFIVRLTQTVEENIADEGLSLDWLCGQMGVSRTQMYRKVKELASMTPVEFIRTVKLNKAAILLRTTGMTVQEIMYNSGFNNKSYFYREFAAKYGCSPKEYRKNKF